jgi:hypothetical protein
MNKIETWKPQLEQKADTDTFSTFSRVTTKV